MHRYLKLPSCLFLLVFILLTASCEKASEQELPPPEVSVYEVQYQRVENTITLPGRTTAVIEAEVRPQISGIIQKRLFIEGAYVKENDILYQIDPALYQAAYDNTKAGVVKAEANLVAAKVRADRYSQVVKFDAVSKQDYDNAKAEYEQARADVSAAKAQMESARINLAYTTIRSPVSGKTGISSVTQGSLVTQGQTNAMTTVQQTNPMYVDVTQSSADLLRLRRELAAGKLVAEKQEAVNVEILMEDGSRYEHTGHLSYDITINKSTGSYTVRAEVPNPESLLMPGMYVRAKLLQGVSGKGVRIPAQSLLRTQKGAPYVLIVNTKNQVQMRQITTSKMLDGDWIVTDGLVEGDKVIVEGLQRAQQAQSREQAAAKAQNREAAPALVRTVPYVSKNPTPETNSQASPTTTKKTVPASQAGTPDMAK